MAYKYVRGLGADDYVHFWFKNNFTGRYINFTVSDKMIEHARMNTDNFCAVLEQIIKQIEEDKFYEPNQTYISRD